MTLRLYKFICEKFGLEAINKNRLKISRLDELNDPFEWMSIDLRNFEMRNGILATRRNMSSVSGLICMSKRWSNPLLWSHYADAHTGLCLGFDVPNNDYGKISYQRQRTSLKQLGIRSSDDITADHLQKLIFTKFSSWRYEQEYRAYTSLGAKPHEIITNKDALYFKSFGDDLKLREVIVGYRSQKTRIQMEYILRDFSDDVILRKARPAFRTFHIVNQRNKYIW
jgi:DUF2971 family protein